MLFIKVLMVVSNVSMCLAYLDDKDSPIKTSFNDLTGKRYGSETWAPADKEKYILEIIIFLERQDNKSLYQIRLWFI